MKELYFPHDFNARHDPNCSSMIASLGMEGYGVYWFFIEILHSENGKIKKFPKLFSGLAHQMKIEEQALLKHFQAMVEDYELLKEDDDFIWSDRVIKNIEFRMDQRQKKQLAGRIGGLKSVENRSTPQAMLKQPASKSKQSKVKESKGKEIKEDTIADFFQNPSQKILEELHKDYNASIDQIKKKCDAMFHWWGKLADKRKREYSDGEKILRNALLSDFKRRVIVRPFANPIDHLPDLTEADKQKSQKTIDEIKSKYPMKTL